MLQRLGIYPTQCYYLLDFYVDNFLRPLRHSRILAMALRHLYKIIVDMVKAYAR